MTVYVQNELLFFRDPATPLVGTSGSSSFAFPGNALSASTLRWYAPTNSAVLSWARWLLAWDPNGASGATSIELAYADSGPSNITQIAAFSRSDTTPVTDAIDITSTLNSLLSGGIEKQLCQRTKGNGTVGAKIYTSAIELIWSIP